MAILLSPGVSVSEVDLTTVVPSVSSSTGAFAGNFVWGPANEIYPITDENQLAATFGAPNGNTAVSFLTASSFLAYGNDLRVVRAVNEANCLNATSKVKDFSTIQFLGFFDESGILTVTEMVGTVLKIGRTLTCAGMSGSAKVTGQLTGSTGLTGTYTTTYSGGALGLVDSPKSITGKYAYLQSIPNKSYYNDTVYHTDNDDAYGAFTARYPGALGNSISVDVWDSSNTTFFKAWDYSGYFNGVSNTSTSVYNAGGANDEIHIIVSDVDGVITGHKGTVLEVYPYLSKAIDAKDDNGVSTYYKNVIAAQSHYIYVTDPVDYANTHATWGSISANTDFAKIYSANTGYKTIRLADGNDAPVLQGDLTDAFDLFSNKDSVDVSLFITGDASAIVQQHIIDNIVTPAGSLVGRSGDSIAFISPPRAAVVNQKGNEVLNIQSWLNDDATIFDSKAGLKRSTSYAVVDSGWKYMFDKYNNVYRWVPMNGDIAGLCAFTDAVRDPWWSPAGYNRGNIKNAVKLAWNPNQQSRDILYQQGVNPVVSFPGNGIILYGDKTLQAKPSAFDRINVRRLFIVLEKAIARAAKYSLFEFNDEFTRAQFISLVSPFLRDVQGRRGIFDFKVVCDTTNNTGYIIDTNQFVGDIYIKPARSINFIKLNFIAVGTGVNFSEVVGKF